MISRNRTFVTVYLAGACEKRPHTVLSLIPSLQGLPPTAVMCGSFDSRQPLAGKGVLTGAEPPSGRVACAGFIRPGEDRPAAASEARARSLAAAAPAAAAPRFTARCIERESPPPLLVAPAVAQLANV